MSDPTPPVDPRLTPKGALRAALMELETAAWSRSWSKLKNARERLRTLLHWHQPIEGPLRSALRAAVERCSCSEPEINDQRICRACGRRFVRERDDDRIR